MSETEEMLKIDLSVKSTVWLKSEHDAFRGVRIGMWQYYGRDGETQLDLELLKVYVVNLKSVLDTRENILNKKEKKLLRQQNAVHGRQK